MKTPEIPAPQTVPDTGVPKSLLEDLALKILFVRGELLLSTLSAEMKLSLAIIADLFQRLRRDQFCEVKGMAGGIHRITTTSMGKARAPGLLSLNQYVGPAPGSPQEYVRQVRAQSVRQGDVGPPALP